MEMRRFAYVIFLAPVVAFAGTPASPPPPTSQPGEGRTEAKICEMKREVGSQQVKRVCLTATERQAEKDKAQLVLNPSTRCSNQEGACNGGL